jgi:hypothetical protein
LKRIAEGESRGGGERANDKVGEEEDDMWVLCVSVWLLRFEG